MFKVLESFRGAAALLVVLFHMPHWNDILKPTFIVNGYLWVNFFFVLSGFVIYSKYFNKINKLNDLVGFCKRRFFRLYPVHLVFLCIFFILEGFKNYAAINYGLTSVNLVGENPNNIHSLIKNIFFIQSVLPNQQLTYNYPSWSASVEFYTCLLFACLVLFAGKYKNILGVLIVALLIIFVAQGSLIGYKNFIACIIGFSCGSLIAYLKIKFPLTDVSKYQIISLVSIIVFFIYKNESTPDYLIYPLSMVLICTVSSDGETLVYKIFNQPVFRYIGAMSYSIYMSHAFVIWCVNQYVRVILGRPESVSLGNYYQPMLNETEGIFYCCLTLFFVLLFSALIFNYIEKPIIRWSRND